jgi:hypothetical protein
VSKLSAKKKIEVRQREQGTSVYRFAERRIYGGIFSAKVARGVFFGRAFPRRVAHKSVLNCKIMLCNEAEKAPLGSVRV